MDNPHRHGVYFDLATVLHETKILGNARKCYCLGSFAASNLICGQNAEGIMNSEIDIMNSEIECVEVDSSNNNLVGSSLVVYFKQGGQGNFTTRFISPVAQMKLQRETAETALAEARDTFSSKSSEIQAATKELNAFEPGRGSRKQTLSVSKP